MLRLLAIAAIAYLTVSGKLPNPADAAFASETLAALAITLLAFPTLRELLD